MSEAGELPEPSLRYRWIKANVYSALFGMVTGLTAAALGKAFGVTDPHTSAVTIAIYSGLIGALAALNFAVFARLTGGVLSRKVPAFPMRTWVLLHVAVGFALGVLISPAAAIPEEVDPEPLEIEMIALVTLASMIVGSLLGALFGSMQALVLRKSARGLATWIGFSALAGTALAIVVLGTYLGPDTGLMKDVVGQAAGFMMQVVVALILLPAVRHLQPRDAPTPAVVPDLPPPAPAAPPPP